MSRRRSLPLSAASALRRVYWRAVGPRTVGVHGLVVDEQGRVLLVRHTYGRKGWYLPGGGVKRRESLTAAVLRELREEAGIEVPRGAEELQLLGAYSDLTEGRSVYLVVFVVRHWRRWATSHIEIDDQRFFHPDELPEEASPATRRRLNEHLGRAPVRYEW